ncbi:hypothetical protein BBP40_007974 [Aspergillus hancockii]|nr:hypothetical protein BBP40_007974 [Aspergillus hancockii]
MSWAQTHPFTVTLWSREKQDTLDLLVQPRRSLSAKFLQHIRPIAEGSISLLALFTGPHGVSVRVSGYESALVVASEIGIAAVIPHVKQMIYGYNTCTSHIRRLHLVWKVESIGIAIDARELLNNLLIDDIMDDGYFTKYMNFGLVKAGSLVPDQLTEVFGRISKVGTIQRWKLLGDIELVDSRDPPPAGASTFHAGSYHVPSVAGDQNGLQPVESDVSIAAQNHQLPVRHGKDTTSPGPENYTPAVQTPVQAQSPSFSVTGASQYLTPPADSPRKRRRTTKRTSTAKQTPTDSGPLAADSDAVIRSLLSHHFSSVLKRKELEQAFRLSARLVSRGLDSVLRPLLETWQNNISKGSPVLGLPPAWKGVKAAVVYIELIREDRISDPVGQRVARMLLVLNYEVICKNPEKYCSRPRQKGERRVPYAMDCITRSYLNNPSGEISKGGRDAIHTCFRQGRWLWTLAGTVGMGLVLTCDDELMSVMKNISTVNGGIEAIATCAYYTRPGTVRLLGSLEPVVISLMLGKISSDLVEAVQVDGSGILGQSALSKANAEDQGAFVSQRETNPWPQLDCEFLASQKKAEVLNNDYDPVGHTPDNVLGAGAMDQLPLDHNADGSNMIDFSFDQYFDNTFDPVTNNFSS